jgi:hypothetical protein
MFKSALASRWRLLRVIATINVVIDVGVPAVIYVDVAATPVAIAPCITPCCAHAHARSKPKR